MGFSEKKPIFQKSDKGSKFAVKCDWISDISHYVTKKRDFEKNIGYSEKLLSFVENRQKQPIWCRMQSI